MHLFLQGAKGVGKSTALQQFLSDSGLPYRGICTYMLEDEHGIRHVYAEALPRAISNDQRILLGMRYPGGKLQPRLAGVAWLHTPARGGREMDIRQLR